MRFGTQLDDEDRAAIAALPKDQRFVRRPSRQSGTLSDEIHRRGGLGNATAARKKARAIRQE